jgi:transposase
MAAKTEPRWQLRDTVVAQSRMMYRASDTQIALIQAMSEAEKSVAAIARAAHCSRATVHRWSKRPDAERAKNPGRPRTVRTPEVMETVAAVVRACDNHPLTAEQLRARVTKTTGTFVSPNMLQHAKKELGIKGKKGQPKPERAFWDTNRRKRVKAAKKRIRIWPKAMRRKLVFMDESCAARDMSRFFQVTRGANGKWKRPIVPRVDGKEEKVHFFVAIGNGITLFKPLAVRRPPLRDGAGKARPRKGRQRRKKGKTANVRLNRPNAGQTWTAARLKTVLRPHLRRLKASAGVVLDNAGAHKELCAYLKRNGIKVFDQPPYSPDLNLAEDFIRDLKAATVTDQLPLDNKQLKAGLAKTAATKSLQRRFLRNHYKRCDQYVKRRLNQVVERGGLPTDV